MDNNNPEDPDKKKKKKKKNKKKDKKEEENGTNDHELKKEPKKKMKTSALDNKNIPEELRQKYHEIEKNPLKIIVANIPLGVTLDELKGYFNTLLTSLKSHLSSTPIIALDVGDTKNFVVIELSSKEMADFCLTLDDLEYQGYRLKIHKPRHFFEKFYDPDKKQIDPYGNIITDAADLDNKIYMGGIPLYLKEEDVKKLCESFGMLKYFNLVKDPGGQQLHKGYTFFEYLDPKSTDRAVKNLNNLEIGDKRLKVQRASGQVQKMEKKETQQPSNSSGSFLRSFNLFSDTQVQAMLNIPLTARTPSRVVQFLNMVTPEDLLEEDVYNELYEDVEQEVSKFGPVERIEIPRPDKETGIIGPAVGKIFVKYQFLIAAKKARYNLGGRTYNRRTVIASFYPEDKFDLKEYLIK